MKLVVGVLLIFLLATIFLYSLVFIPAFKTFSNTYLIEKFNTIASVYGNSISRAMKHSDDLLLLGSIESIMKFEGVFSSYVLDKNGKVITHSDTHEWGKVYEDAISRKAIRSANRLMQPANKPQEYIFSVPLSSSSTLCIGFSKEKAEKMFEGVRSVYLYTSALMLILAAGMIIFLFNMLFAAKLRQLEYYLTSISLSKGARIPDLGKDELGSIARQINEFLSATGQNRSSHTEQQTDATRKVSALMQEVFSRLPFGLALLDPDHKILSANKLFWEPLSLGKDIIGKHVLDVIKKPELLALIRDSSENPGSDVKRQIAGKETVGRAVLDSRSEIAGIILIIS